jgi:Tol biopolymer transport system component
MPRAVPMRKTIPLCALTALLLGGPLAAWAGQLDLLSRIPPRRASDTAGGASGNPALSADGRWTVFLSNAANLSPGQSDDNQVEDVFLHDHVTGAVTLVSHAASSSLAAGDQGSEAAVISADGRWIAYVSRAANLVAGEVKASDSNVFLYDRITGATTLVSRSWASPRLSGNGDSTQPAVSANGRYVAFSSTAEDLVNRQSGHAGSVFLFDRVTGKTTLVSHKAGVATQTNAGISDSPAISADGRYVAFSSSGGDLVPGQIEAFPFSSDVFVHDRLNGRNILVSHASGSPLTAVGGERPGISAGGDDVTFVSYAPNLVPGQSGGGSRSLFLFRRPTGVVTLVSHTAASATQTSGSDDVFNHAAADDGSWVAFTSTALDLVPGQIGDFVSTDVFLWERASGAIRLVSHSFGQPAREARGDSYLAGLSADGQRLLIGSEAGNFAAAGSDGPPGFNVFLYDRSSDRAVLASYAGDGGDDGGNARSGSGALSADGNWIAFTSEATDLTPGKKDLNQAADLFLYGRATGGRELVSRRDPGLPSATPQAMSLAGDLDAGGRYAVFISDSVELVPGARDVNGLGDIFLYDRTLRKTTLVSHAAGSPLLAANAESSNPRISADGRYVVYLSEASDLIPGQVDNTPQGSSGNSGSSDAFLYDRTTGQTTLVSRSADSPVTAINQVRGVKVSADGSSIAFTRSFRHYGVYLYDRSSAATTLVSRAAGTVADEGNDDSFLSALSADGRFVVLASYATDLVSGVQTIDDRFSVLYLYDKAAGELTLISHPAGAPSVALGAGSAAISADGHYIAFQSYLNGFVPGEADDNFLDVYLHDRVTGTTLLVSHEPGAPTTPAGARDEPPVISADGRFVAYAGGHAGSQHQNIFLFDRISGRVQLVSGGPQGEEANGECSHPRIAADGRYIAFSSQATNLTADPIEGDPLFLNVASNAYLYDRTTKRTALVSRSFRPPYGGGNSDSADNPRTDVGGLALSGSGGYVLFDSFASNLAPGDFNQFRDSSLSDVFLYSPTP